MYEEASAKQAAWMASAPISDVRPIEGALADLHQNINSLEESLEKLRARVGTVLGPITPQPCGNKSECSPTPSRSTTWSTINAASDRITSISADIRELTSRLET